MIHTAVPHSSGVKSTVGEPKMTRDNAVKEVTQASPLFSYNEQNPYSNWLKKTNKRILIDSHS